MYVDTIWLTDCTLKPKGIDLVNGKHRYESASLQRSYWNFVIWRCAKKGRFWKKREWLTALEVKKATLDKTLDKIKSERIDRRIKSMKSVRRLK